jgi:hypothetical protein
MMQHNALPPTALQDGAAKAARNKLQNALEASLLFHSPLSVLFSALLPVVYQHVNNRSTK